MCVRTYFLGEKGERTRWSKNKIYSGREPSMLEKRGGIMFYVESDTVGPNGSPVQYFIKEKEYAKHFRPLDEVRNERIEKILGR